MRIGIYDPYLDTLGGGEKYIFDIARGLSQDNDITIFWDDETIKSKIQVKFGYDLAGVAFKPNIFSKNVSTLKRMRISRAYDALFVISDGSIPLVLSNKLFLIFHYPIPGLRLSLVNKFKTKKISGILVYSSYIKNYISQQFSSPIYVVPPEVDEIDAQSAKKEQLILHVGRFTSGVNDKKQTVLLDAFRELHKKELKNWKLVFAGSFIESDRHIYESLKKEAKGLPVDVLSNLDKQTLNQLYKKAKIYWHATGYGEDIEKHPERVEHFGITTVEAMSAGAVPVVINLGGQPEIVEDGKNGFLWNTIEELKKKTLSLTLDEKLREQIAKQAAIRAKDFNRKRFDEEIKSLIA